MVIDKPLAEAILNWFIQVVGLISAIVFGIFSILAWIESVKATRESISANILSMLMYCDTITRVSINLVGGRLVNFPYLMYLLTKDRMNHERRMSKVFAVRYRKLRNRLSLLSPRRYSLQARQRRLQMAQM
jgi:hypothetical protein